jgi:hypothetical protein
VYLVKLNPDLDGKFKPENFGFLNLIAPVAGGVLITGV